MKKQYKNIRDITTTTIVSTLFVLTGSMANLYGEKIYFHRVNAAEVSVVHYSEPIHLKWDMIDGDQSIREKYGWLDAYLTFNQLDQAENFDVWIESATEDYVESFSITKELFLLAKKNYDTSAGDDLVGKFDSLFYAVYFTVEGRELCRVVGASSDNRFSDLSEAEKADSGFLTLFFEKIDGRWKIQIPSSRTWVDDISILPSNIEFLETASRNHFVRVKNYNKLESFEINGVRDADLVLEP